MLPVQLRNSNQGKPCGSICNEDQSGGVTLFHLVRPGSMFRSTIMGKIAVLLADDHALVREGLRALLAVEEDIEIGPLPAIT